MFDNFKIYIISHLGWEEQCEKQQRPTFPLQRSPLLTQTYSRWEIHQQKWIHQFPVQSLH